MNSEDGGILSLFEQNNFDSLKLLYKLYNPINDGLKLIAEKFKLQMTDSGKKLLESTETQNNGKDIPIKVVLVNSQVVEKVIGILTRNRSMIDDCFNSDTLFDRQL